MENSGNSQRQQTQANVIQNYQCKDSSAALADMLPPDYHHMPVQTNIPQPTTVPNTSTWPQALLDTTVPNAFAPSHAQPMNWSQTSQMIPPPQQYMEHYYPSQSTSGVSDEARLLNEYLIAMRQTQQLRTQLSLNNTNFGQPYPSASISAPIQYPGSRYDMVSGSGGGYGHHYSNALPSHWPLSVSNLAQPTNMIHAPMASMANMAQIQRNSMAQAESTDKAHQIPQYQSPALTTPQQSANATIAEPEEAGNITENKDSVSNQGVIARGEAATQTKKNRASRKPKGGATSKGKNNKRTADDLAETSTPSTKKQKATKAALKKTVHEPDENELEGAADEEEDEAEQVESIPISEKAKGKRPVEKEDNGQAGPSESLDMLERQCCYHCKVKKTRCSLRQMKRGRDEDTTNPGLTCERCQAKDLICTATGPGPKRGPREGWACAPRLLEMLRRDDERLLYRWCSTMLLKDHLVPRVETTTDTETTSTKKTETPPQNNFAYLVGSDGGTLSKAFSETAIFQALRPKEKDRAPLPDTEVRNGLTVMTKTPDRSDSNYRLAIDLVDRRGGAVTEATHTTTRAEEVKLEWEIARDLARAAKARHEKREQQISAMVSITQAEQAPTGVSAIIPLPLPLPAPIFSSPPAIQQSGAGVPQAPNHDEEVAGTEEHTWAADPVSVSAQPETQGSLTSGDFNTTAAASPRRPIFTSVPGDRCIDPRVLSIDPSHPSIDFLNYQYSPSTTFTFNSGQPPILGTSEDASTLDF